MPITRRTRKTSTTPFKPTQLKIPAHNTHRDVAVGSRDLLDRHAQILGLVDGDGVVLANEDGRVQVALDVDQHGGGSAERGGATVARQHAHPVDEGGVAGQTARGGGDESRGGVDEEEAGRLVVADDGVSHRVEWSLYKSKK